MDCLSINAARDPVTNLLTEGPCSLQQCFVAYLLRNS